MGLPPLEARAGQFMVMTLLTYATLYRDRTGDLPARCVLFFIKEPPDKSRRLVAIDVTEAIVGGPGLDLSAGPDAPCD